MVTAAGDASMHERDEVGLVHVQLSNEEDGDKVTEGRVLTAAGDAVLHERDEIGLVHLQLSNEEGGDKVTEGRVVTAAGSFLLLLCSQYPTFPTLKFHSGAFFPVSHTCFCTHPKELGRKCVFLPFLIHL